jgi:hypothetical protein
MREVGIDLSQNKPQKLSDELARGAYMLVMLVVASSVPSCPGCGATTGRWRIPERQAAAARARDPRRDRAARAAFD